LEQLALNAMKGSAICAKTDIHRHIKVKTLYPPLRQYSLGSLGRDNDDRNEHVTVTLSAVVTLAL